MLYRMTPILSERSSVDVDKVVVYLCSDVISRQITGIHPAPMGVTMSRVSDVLCTGLDDPRVSVNPTDIPLHT